MEMILKELSDLTDLSEAQTLCIPEIMEMVIVCKDKNLILATFEVMVLCLKDFDNS